MVRWPAGGSGRCGPGLGVGAASPTSAAVGGISGGPGERFAEDGGYTDVPSEDLCALRRAILDLDEFHASADGSEGGKATLTTGMASQQTPGSLTLLHQTTSPSGPGRAPPDAQHGLRPSFVQVRGRVVLVLDSSSDLPLCEPRAAGHRADHPAEWMTRDAGECPFWGRFRPDWSVIRRAGPRWLHVRAVPRPRLEAEERPHWPPPAMAARRG
jgi:hypothetical protein